MVDMGNIRTKDIKRTAWELFEEHPEMFSPDFEKNKEALRDMIPQKSFRNKVAGYLVRVAKQKAASQ